MSHFPAPCLTVTRERRVSERNHPYNCWGQAGMNGKKERRYSRRDSEVGLRLKGERRDGKRVETADEVCRSIERGREGPPWINAVIFQDGGVRRGFLAICLGTRLPSTTERNRRPLLSSLRSWLITRGVRALAKSLARNSTGYYVFPSSLCSVHAQCTSYIQRNLMNEKLDLFDNKKGW